MIDWMKDRLSEQMNDSIWLILTTACKNQQQNKNMSQNVQPEVVVISIQYVCVGKQIITFSYARRFTTAKCKKTPIHKT